MLSWLTTTKSVCIRGILDTSTTPQPMSSLPRTICNETFLVSLPSVYSISCFCTTGTCALQHKFSSCFHKLALLCSRLCSSSCKPNHISLATTVCIYLSMNYTAKKADFSNKGPGAMVSYLFDCQQNGEHNAVSSVEIYEKRNTQLLYL